jgi:hypothetical protein
MARRNHLLKNTFLISLVYWFDEGRAGDVTGLVKINADYADLVYAMLLGFLDFADSKSLDKKKFV